MKFSKLAPILMCALLFANHKTFTADSSVDKVLDKPLLGMATIWGVISVGLMAKDGYLCNKNKINASVLATVLNILSARLSKDLDIKFLLCCCGNILAACALLTAHDQDIEDYARFGEEVCNRIRQVESDYEYIFKFLDQNKDASTSTSMYAILGCIGTRYKIRKDLKALRALLKEIKQKAKTPELWQRYFEIQDLVEKLDQVLNIPIAIPEASVYINASC